MIALRSRTGHQSTTRPLLQSGRLPLRASLFLDGGIWVVYALRCILVEHAVA
jgi:hypothetical protein